MRAHRGSVVCVFVVLAMFGAGLASGSSTLSFTTESGKAKELIEEITRAIEGFAAGSVLQQLANDIAEADPDFAYGVMLTSLFQLNDQAMETFEKAKALAEKATRGEQLYIQAMLHSRNGEIDEAVGIFNQLARMHPGERRVQMMLGQLHMNQGRMALAGVHFGRAAAMDDSTGRVHAFIGNIYLMEGDYEAARRHFDEAEQLAPGGIAFQAHGGRIFSYLYQGQPEKALKAADHYLQAYRAGDGNQTFPEVFIWNMKGRIQLENGNPDAALEAYEAGIETLRESEVATLNNFQRQTWEGRYLHGKARALAKKGKFDEAWEIAEGLKQQIEEGGEQAQQFLPAYHYLAGYIRLEEGKASEAIEHLEKADPNDPFHKMLAARAYVKLGEKAKARELYQTVADFQQNTMERSLSYREAVEALEKLG